MELRVLKYFLVVAREENITRAAKMLHITQPTLSRQLRQLEEELGVELFRRSKHSIILTPAGMLLRRRAQEFADLEMKTEREMQSRDEAISGVISIGIGETVSIAELAEGMKTFRQLHPDVTFEIYTAIADDVKERMENGLLDFGILLEPVDISKYNFIRMAREDRWVALMRKDSPLAAKDRVTAADLVHQPLIIPKRKSVQNLLEHWFGEMYQVLNVPVVLNLSVFNKATLVHEGLGIALGIALGMDPGFAGESIDEELCHRPLWPPIYNGCVLAWKKNQFQSPAVAHFIDFMRKDDEEE